MWLLRTSASVNGNVHLVTRFMTVTRTLPLTFCVKGLKSPLKLIHTVPWDTREVTPVWHRVRRNNLGCCAVVVDAGIPPRFSRGENVKRITCERARCSGTWTYTMIPISSRETEQASWWRRTGPTAWPFWQAWKYPPPMKSSTLRGCMPSAGTKG